MKLRVVLLLAAMLSPLKAKRLIMLARNVNFIDEQYAEFMIVALGLDNA